MAEFTVDTKLFRELGELLVGKESTALVELIKNAYDADATEVTVLGENLSDPHRGRIIVRDDGHGMDTAEFARGFLRIGGRTKAGLDSRSPVYRRRFTGEKGIGRLSAHKLATRLRVVSAKATDKDYVLVAKIDWSAIERLETLAEVSSSNAVIVKRRRSTNATRTGTLLHLAPIRKAWTTAMTRTFHSEALTLVPYHTTWQSLPTGLTVEPLLFDEIPIRDSLNRNDPGLKIQFHGDLAVPDSLIPSPPEAASWVAEIDYNSGSGILRIAVSPTNSNLSTTRVSEGFRIERNEGASAGPSFSGRIFQKSNKSWPDAFQGVRIYMEGFRVPPYGDLTDDWLGLDKTYRNRTSRRLTSLETLGDLLPSGEEKEELSIQSQHAYFGAIFLHRKSSAGLQMLVNREGFLPGPEIAFIAKWTRVALDLIVRLGYSARKEFDEVRSVDKKKQQAAARRADVGETPTSLLIREDARAVQEKLAAAELALKGGDIPSALQAVNGARPHLVNINGLAAEAMGEAVLWRLLASLGTELAAFIHEINALAIQAEAIVSALDKGISSPRSSKAESGTMAAAKRAALDLAERIKRNAAYLVDATSFQGRRRRSRLPLRERFEAVVPFFRSRLENLNIQLENGIPGEIRTPPMFPAELAGIFTNLLSNAVKFSGVNGRIQIGATRDDEQVKVTMENTGVPVNLSRAERLFQAFQSTTEIPDAILGQGMGLGLTITRAFVQEYGGEIHFVEPQKNFATAIEFSIPVG